MSYFRVVSESTVEGKPSFLARVVTAFCYLPLLAIESALKVADVITGKDSASKFYMATEHVAALPLAKMALLLTNTAAAIFIPFVACDISARHKGKSQEWKFAGSEVIANIIGISPYKTDRRKLDGMVDNYMTRLIYQADELAIYFDYKRSYNEADFIRKLRDQVITKQDFSHSLQALDGVEENLCLDAVKYYMNTKIEDHFRLSGHFSQDADLAIKVLTERAQIPQWKRPVEIPGQKATESPSTEMEEIKIRRVKDSYRKVNV